MAKSLLTFIISILCFNVFAGEIKGVVKDGKTYQPLTGVIIAAGNGKGTVTDFDGNYEITGLPNGTYELTFSYVSYLTQKKTVEITGNTPVVLDIVLAEETTELTGVTVKATKVSNTENAVINEIKNSTMVVSGVSSAQISKSQDRNAADVVKRIPGVTIQEDRFIVVRGLSDRYNTVWLNDAGTPSSETDKKSFSFDLIPSGLIDRILVFKTPSPELPGDFAGGMVKIYTTSLVDKNTFSVGISTSSREFSTGTQFNYNEASKTDWLGYDDGKRKLPSTFPTAEVLNVKNQYYKDNINTWSKSFGNDWIMKTKSAPLDGRFNASMSNVWKLGNVKLGNTAGVTYSNTYSNYNITRQDGDSTGPDYKYIDRQSTNQRVVGFVENIGATIGNTKLEFKNLYNQVGKSTFTYRTNAPDTAGKLGLLSDIRAYKMDYDSKATYSTQLSGSHKNVNGTRKYTWTIGYDDLFKNQPDMRKIKYSKQKTDSVYLSQVPSGTVDLNNGGGRYYASLYEKVKSFSHQFTQAIKIKDYSFDINAGNYFEFRNRSFQARELGYLIKSGASALALKKLGINEIFADSNVGATNKFLIGEGTSAYDRYSGENKQMAGFLSFKAPLGQKMILTGGARYEHNEQHILGYLSTDTLNQTAKTDFILPSVNFSYNFNEKNLIRAAYGKTLNRPELREVAPSFFYDFDELLGVYGSMYPSTALKSGKPNFLKVAEVNNVDVRYEFYPGSGELVHIGGFYKQIMNPIQRIILPGISLDNKSVSYINGERATCYGLEADARKNLGFLDSMFHANIFSHFFGVANVTVGKSEMLIDTTKTVDQQRKSSFQGQSDYVVNLGLFFQHDSLGIQSSLLFNTFGPRMFALGGTKIGAESIGELPFHSFDFLISKTFQKHFTLSFGVQNLLDSKVKFVKDVNFDNKFTKNELTYKEYSPGRYFTIGLKIKF